MPSQSCAETDAQCNLGVWCSAGSATIHYANGTSNSLNVASGFCWPGSGGRLSQQTVTVDLTRYGYVNVTVSCTGTLTDFPCPAGQYLSGSACKACPSLFNAASVVCTCGSTSCTSIVECSAGYYLVQGTCTSCTASYTGCLSMSNCSSAENVFCLQCAPGYYWSNGQCSSCVLAMAGCATCDSQQTCASCSSGYTLNSGQCSSSSGLSTGAILGIVVAAAFVGVVALVAGVRFLWRAA